MDSVLSNRNGRQNVSTSVGGIQTKKIRWKVYLDSNPNTGAREITPGIKKVFVLSSLSLF
jgi:hypothetical protein